MVPKHPHTRWTFEFTVCCANQHEDIVEALILHQRLRSGSEQACSDFDVNLSSFPSFITSSSLQDSGPRWQGRDWFPSEAAMMFCLGWSLSWLVHGELVLHHRLKSTSLTLHNALIIWSALMMLLFRLKRLLWKSISGPGDFQSSVLEFKVHSAKCLFQKKECMRWWSTAHKTASYTECVDGPAAVHPGCPPLAPCCCTCPFQGSLICLMH